MKSEKLSPNTIVVNGHTLSFPMKVHKILDLQDRVVVLVNSRYWADTDPEGSRNVYCYGADGTLLWRIQSSGEMETEGDVVEIYFGYADILYDAAKDKLEAIGAECEFEIDKDTGRIIAFRFRDRF